MKCSFMSRAFLSEQKKCETNSVLRSDVTCVGMPCLENTWRRKSCASLGKVIVLCVGMNSACFKRWSTMTRIVVKLEDVGSCSIKSMEMEFHGHSGMGSCLSIP